ncbi:2-dehydro-3-deoxygluconokinase [Sedimentisphaera cyanobacteriorum]|uniref:2-dehydro-3-deoxygluconokinase n=1 Tax=Sedimentisphaera cyanobacteriorum TaxID=1940790 RepID=A0A1Q2HM58_9BACT|nr:sugar kinase [Sedimentisphaera cyanobacteriorum]AQQ08542.1 2-dehydro-3-deoxygluconokinase [Sedimentisphaera cyanobacteriorum]
MKKVITFGEIMARIMPEGFMRFRQCLPGKVNMLFAGAEANVAVSISQLGGKAAFVTALPKNDIAAACIAELRSLGVGTSHIIHNDGRLGLYFTETGANQRPSRIIYDRSHSAISKAKPDAYDWNGIFADAGWLHISGITPALSKEAAQSTLAAVKNAKQASVTISCDLNFRGKLWKWEPGKEPKSLAREVMSEIVPYVDVLIANEEDAACVLGIEAENTDVQAGRLDVNAYKDVAIKIHKAFPNVDKIATTFRQSVSASHNNWGAMLYDCEQAKAYYAPTDGGEYQPYKITDIVDRVGGGDAFAAGLIFALNTSELAECQKAVSFAAATSCLAHSIKGDFNFSSRNEVEALAGGSASGRVVR